MGIHPSYSYTPKDADTPISGDAPISRDTTHMDSTELMAQMDSLAIVASNLDRSVCVVKPCCLLKANGWFALALSNIDKHDTTTGETFLLSSDEPYIFHISLLTKKEYRYVEEWKVAAATQYIALFSPSREACRADANVHEHEWAMAGLLSWTTEDLNSEGHSECLDIALLDSHAHALLDSHAHDQCVESLESRTGLLLFLHHIRHLLGLPERLKRQFRVSLRRLRSDGTYTIDEINCSDDDNSSQEDGIEGDNVELCFHRTSEGHLVNSGNDVPYVFAVT
jgi:hypothetical protein